MLALTITPETPADPNAKPPANAVETATGGVVIDPSKPAGDKPTAAPAAGERPTWLPEKFKTAEEMATAYKALETKQSTAAAPTAEAAAAAVKQAGLDVNAISKEYVANDGKLTPATMKTLADKGITTEMVNGYISGLQAQATQMRTNLEAVAGGAEQLQSVYSWAATNMDAQELQAYNSLIESGNGVGAKVMLQGIVSRFTVANGSDPKLISGDSSATSGDVAAFESSHQVVEAMRDPRYQTDEAYRNKVAARLAVTQMFGVK